MDKVTTDTERQLVDQAFAELKAGYLASKHRRNIEIIERAFNCARAAHAGVRRRSGEPYIMHPLAVAKIVSQELGLGSTSICAALLHDVVEDTDLTVEDIAMQFNPTIARIVDGVTKISGGKFNEDGSTQAANFRKLLVAMSDDLRVVLVKTADRLHNMRTLASMPKQKQHKIIGETTYIYAPLAHRMGLYAIKTELEDLCFKWEHPEQYEQIAGKIAMTEEQRNAIFARFSAPIRQRLDQKGLNYTFTARVKSCASIARKMEAKHLTFEEIYDIYAARIVFTPPENTTREQEALTCFSIYTIITSQYRVHPDRLRDFITTPKDNHYSALHATVMGPDGKWVEVQIRSKRMDDIAERGLAAHWRYKDGEQADDSSYDNWVDKIKEMLDEGTPEQQDEFFNNMHMSLTTDDIQVFTPSGEVITLPSGATVLDFAFTLHTHIGAHCIAGKISHKLVPISQQLHNGDQVEIITSASQKPQPDWRNFVITSKGRSGLASALKQERRAIADAGRDILTRWLAEHDYIEDNNLIVRLLANTNLRNKDELLQQLGSGSLTLTPELLQPKKKQRRFGDFLRNPFNRTNNDKQSNDSQSDNKQQAIDTKKEYALTITDGQANYITASCCRPIPGDLVLGIINDRGKVVVHKVDCPQAIQMKSLKGNRIVATRWETGSATFPVNIHVDGTDRHGVLQEIIAVISTEMRIDLRSLHIDSTNGVFNCDLGVMVQDASVVEDLCRHIKKVRNVTSVARIDTI